VTGGEKIPIVTWKKKRNIADCRRRAVLAVKNEGEGRVERPSSTTETPHQKEQERGNRN